MPIKFQRPENLPEDIPIYHVSCPDHNADLLLKITALGSNKIAVIPTYKEVVADLIPNYFGEIFKEGKNFNESRLDKDEYFEFNIPNLTEPKLFADILKNLQVEDSIGRGIENEDYVQVFYLASYFQIEPLLEFLRKATVVNDSKKFNIKLFTMLSMASASDKSFDSQMQKQDCFDANGNSVSNHMKYLRSYEKKYDEIADDICDGIEQSLPMNLSNLSNFANRHIGKCNMGLSFQCYNRVIPLEIDADLICRERKIHAFNSNARKWQDSTRFAMDFKK